MNIIQNQSTSTYSFSNIHVHILIGNIVDQECDAIVNSANIYLQKGSGVCGTIFQGAGLELKSACDEHILKLGRNLYVGEAVITSGFNLKAKYIIHSVSPRCMFRWNESLEEAMRLTYQTIFQIADNSNIETIAIPAMGIGHHYCDLDRCVSIAMTELFNYLNQTNPKLKEIRFILFDEQTKNKYIEIGDTIFQKGAL